MTLDNILTITRDVAAPNTTTLTRGREAALTAVREDLANRARIVRRRTRRRAVCTLAALTVAAVAVVFVAVPGGKTTSNPVSIPAPPVVEARFANASEIVTAAAISAGRKPDELADAPYWKVVSEYEQTDAENPEQNSTGKRTIWQGITGPSVLSDTFGGDLFVEGPLSLPQATLTTSGHTYTWREVNAGALDQDQIHDVLTAGEEGIPTKPGRAPHEWYFFKQAGELLSETPASPAVRQAIWREVHTLTGVTTTGKVTDAMGRDGWNLTFALEGFGSQRFIVDPSTGAILQSEVVRNSTTYRMTYLRSGPANSAPTPSSQPRMPVEPSK